MTGAQETRFLQSLHGASADEVSAASREWRSCSQALQLVSDRMTDASRDDKTIHGRTGKALGAAFVKSAQTMKDKAIILNDGADALHHASAAISDARTALHNMNTDPDSTAMTDPGPKVTTTQEDAKDPDIVDKHRTHNKAVDTYQAHVDKREHISQKWADHMDTVFENSTDTMKGISGWQPPPPPPAGYDGQGTYTPTNTPSPNQPTSNPGHNHHGVITTHPTNPGHPTHPGHPGTGTTPGSPQGPIASPGAPTPGSPTGPGIGPAPTPGAPPVAPPGSSTPVGTTPAAPPSGLNPGLTGGLVGGTVLGTGGLIAGIKNGVSVPGMSTRGVGSIGSTRVSGSSSVLSRSSSSLSEEGVAGTRTSPTSRVGGVGGAGGAGGARAGGTGSGSGSRGGRGGRGAGTGAGGRGRGKDKRKRAGDRDLFDDGQDWLDDEGAAPGVLE